jgi:RimJ/RimL family protein N-acetyltransferase
MNSGNIWFVKSAWGQGFNQEIWFLIIKMAFEDLGVNEINRSCFADNERSRKSIISSGFCINESMSVSQRYLDGIYMDVLNFTLHPGR